MLGSLFFPTLPYLTKYIHLYTVENLETLGGFEQLDVVKLRF